MKEKDLSTTSLLPILPEPTGPYRIGFTRYDLEDCYRKDFQFPNGRLIPIQIYFPIEKGSHTVYPKIFEERAALGPFKSLNVSGYSQKIDLFHLTEGKHPIIFLNHASCVAMTDYAFLTEDLSSHGYVVISIQHDLKFDEAVPSFLEGSSCTRNAKVIDNILFVFEWLKANQATSFQEKIDLKRVGLIGHSLGGNSLALWLNRTLDAFHKDTRSALLHRSDQQGVKECLILIESTKFSFPLDSRYPLFFLLAEEREAYQKETGCYEQMILAGHKIRYYKGSTHISFMDHGYAHPQSGINEDEAYFSGPIEERRAFFENVRQDIRCFLKEHGV